MNSCLYETQITHCRRSPKEHWLKYKFFSFYLDLDELDILSRKVGLVGYNRPNVYALHDRDYLEPGDKPIKQKLLTYLKQNGVAAGVGRIMLLTYLRSWGYIFNPVSFYFCFDQEQKPLSVVLEIGNTFKEAKLFLIKGEKYDGGKFVDRQVKNYYISPFTNCDDALDMVVPVPAERLNIHIGTVRDGQKYVMAVMTGQKRELNLKNLLWYTLRFPGVTLKVIGLIHWHAGLLYLKKVPFHPKEENGHLQKGVCRGNFS